MCVRGYGRAKRRALVSCKKSDNKLKELEVSIEHNDRVSVQDIITTMRRKQRAKEQLKKVACHFNRKKNGVVDNGFEVQKHNCNDKCILYDLILM